MPEVPGIAVVTGEETDVGIAGYAFQAAVWCGDCVRTLAMGNVERLTGLAPDRAQGNTEHHLDGWAQAAGVDRRDERSFDSGDFPKLILDGEAHDGCFAANGYEQGQCGDTCDQCSEQIGSGCPNTES